MSNFSITIKFSSLLPEEYGKPRQKVNLHHVKANNIRHIGIDKKHIRYNIDLGSHFDTNINSSFHKESSDGCGNSRIVLSRDQNDKGKEHSLLSFLHDATAPVIL